MINLYTYTYDSAMKEFARDGFILCKVGDTTRDAQTRLDEQGDAAEWQRKIVVGTWNNLTKIARDYDVHKVLKQSGLHYYDGKGSEWFKIPAINLQEAFKYIDDIVTSLEGCRIRDKVKLRTLQDNAINKAMIIIDNCVKSGQDVSSIIANLCPRFGKTIWALMLFNKISEKYGNRIMYLPAYWLSSHTSFLNELNEYNDFLDMREIDINHPDAEIISVRHLKNGLRIVIPISLHGEFSEWSEKHKWLTNHKLDDIFMFADEGDFGTHTENQAAKLEFLFKR